jgi:CheY-like chemotaxis protein
VWSPDTLELFCTLLQTHGYTTAGVPDANAAVEQVPQQVPDMLLIDYMAKYHPDWTRLMVT